MQATWQLQEAKNKFSGLVNAALQDGPQIVTRRGEKTVVVIAYEQYEAITAPKLSLKEWLLNAPQVLDQPLDTTMANDTMREIVL